MHELELVPMWSRLKWVYVVRALLCILILEQILEAWVLGVPLARNPAITIAAITLLGGAALPLPVRRDKEAGE